MKRKIRALLLLAGLILLQLGGCRNQRTSEIVVKENNIFNYIKQEVGNIQEELKKVEEAEVKEDSFASIVSFGDTLCHKPVDDAVYDEAIDDYDFSPIFKYIEKYFENATIIIGNCESPMAGKERGYSGYPAFNGPEHLAIDLKELGVDIMSTANNHTLDKGFSGLSSTIEFLDKQEIASVGTARTQEEQNTILFRNLNGIRTAFLAYTYGTNGIPLTQDKPFCVNLIDKDLMLSQINKAKEEGAELIVVSIHWGVEYQTTENEEQKEIAEFLVKNDVKIILGSHPHVLQPMKTITVEDDKGEEKKGLIIYSQGNFFSNQRQENTRNTAIFNIQIKKDGKTGEVTVKSSTYTPLYMNIKEKGAKDRYELLDLNEIIRSYEAGEDVWTETMYKLAVTERQRCVNLIEPESN